MKSKRPELYIPIQIRRRKEYIDGYGKQELIKTILMGFIGLFIGIILYIKIKNEIVIIISVTALSGLTFLLTRKDKTNRSPLDYLKDDLRFSFDNNKYYYKYKNIYEKDVKND